MFPCSKRPPLKVEKHPRAVAPTVIPRIAPTLAAIMLPKRVEQLQDSSKRVAKLPRKPAERAACLARPIAFTDNCERDIEVTKEDEQKARGGIHQRSLN